MITYMGLAYLKKVSTIGEVDEWVKNNQKSVHVVYVWFLWEVEKHIKASKAKVSLLHVYRAVKVRSTIA